jgi:hypothetical protein
MAILAAIQKEEKKYGEEMVREELEKIAIQRNAPHVEWYCSGCQVKPLGEYIYCERSKHHVDHYCHVCPMTQDCPCSELSD